MASAARSQQMGLTLKGGSDVDQENVAPHSLLSPLKCPNANGVAFEVQIKSPQKQTGSDKATPPGKARLEGYGENRTMSPSERKGSSERRRRLRAEEMAEKARENNEKKRETTERVRADYDEATEAKRNALEQDQEEKRMRREARIASTLAKTQRSPQETEAVTSITLLRQQKGKEAVEKIERAAEKRREALAEISLKAGKHFDHVKSTSEVCQAKQAEEAAVRTKQLEESLAQKAALHEAGIAERGGRASQHNEAVAGKVQKHLQEVKNREEELLNKIQQKSGSKIDGRVTQATLTGGLAIAAAARGVAREHEDASIETATPARRTVADLLAKILPC